MNKKIKFFFPSLILITLFMKFAVWDNPSNRWLVQDLYQRPDSNYKATVAPSITFMSDAKSFYINDASKLNPTSVSEYIKVQSREQIQESVQKAKSQKKSISLSGARHSMGGQNVGTGIHLDMNTFDKVIDYSEENKSVTVQSGVTWKILQEYLGQKNRAVAVMQDSNIFTVGGSMGSNIHGKDIRYGQLIDSINWFKIILATGEEVKVSRNENKELFGSVIGGFGGFGVITEVNLKTEPNTNYQYTITHQSSDQIVTKWNQYIKEGAEHVEGHFSVDKDNFLQDLQIYYFKPTDKISKDDVSGENSIWLRKIVYRLSRDSDLGKKFRWWMQTYVSPIVDPGYSTRNGSMSAPFRVLELDDKDSTDILQEYFVPTGKLDKFLQKYKELLKQNKMNLINCGLRRVQADTEALVNYSSQEMYGFVCYYNVSRDTTKNIDLRVFTGQMLDYLNTIEGKFYLAYNTEGYTDKIMQMYPKLKDLLVLKQKYDPENIFDNNFLKQISKII
jgi:decaprenylphospho-beta-D-ribofuranose 2-oxidase